MSRKLTFNCLRIVALTATLLCISPLNFAASPNDEGESSPSLKVRVLSFTLGESQQRARAVVQPCVQLDACNNVDVYIDQYTELLDNGKEISLQEAQLLTWTFAVINLSASNTAQMFVRVPELY